MSYHPSIHSLFIHSSSFIHPLSCIHLSIHSLTLSFIHPPIHLIHSYMNEWQDMGDIEGARALFSKGATQAPRHCPTWQAWGMLEWELGQISRARSERGLATCCFFTEHLVVHLTHPPPLQCTNHAPPPPSPVCTKYWYVFLFSVTYGFS